MPRARVASLSLLFLATLSAQRPPQPPPVISPAVSADRKITFRLGAPDATEVRVVGGDIPDNQKGAAMTKGENGVWEVTLGPVPAGAYRYHFNIGSLAITDPRNPATSESNNNT